AGLAVVTLAIFLEYLESQTPAVPQRIVTVRAGRVSPDECLKIGNDGSRGFQDRRRRLIIEESDPDGALFRHGVEVHRLRGAARERAPRQREENTEACRAEDRPTHGFSAQLRVDLIEICF